MEVQNDIVTGPLTADVFHHPVQGLLNAEFQANPSRLGDQSLATIIQRFSTKTAWLMPDAGPIAKLNCRDLASTLHAQATIASPAWPPCAPPALAVG